MKNHSFKMLAIILIILMSISLLYGCADQTALDGQEQLVETNSLSLNDIVVTQYNPELDNPKDTLFGVSATSMSSRMAGRIGDNLVVQGIEEAIVVSFWQTGKDRNVSLAIYYDYVAVPFRVGTQGEFCDSYNFEIENNTALQIPVYLDSKIEVDTMVHRIIFVFTPGYDEYAKDKDSISFNASIPQMYQLHYENYEEDVEYIDVSNQYIDDCQHFSYASVPLMLNTDISNLNDADFSGLTLSDKYYVVSDTSSFDMNCIITNTTQSAKTALVFVTVGHSPAKINGQDYLLIDLGESSMTVCNISIDLPSQSGAYDVIGYVVYEPFTSESNDDTAFPQTSNRFTIEINE